jgi:DNA polymerase III epsilon subunit-like protein
MKKLKYNQKYICFDTETEGLNLYYSRPWQVSWVLGEGNKVVEEQDRFIKYSDLELSDMIKKLTGYNQRTYDSKKESIRAVYDDLAKYLYDPEYIIIGQNLLGFDVYMVAIMQRMLGIEPDFSYIDRIYDTRALGKAYRENLDKPSGDFLSWQYKIINDRSLKSKVSQGVLLKHLDIDHDPKMLHNALYDVKMCFQVFCKLKKGLDL